jgi:hypothetical protein
MAFPSRVALVLLGLPASASRLNPGTTHRSLGAAISTLCTLDLRQQHPTVEMAQYTFGQPRVGNQVGSSTCVSAWRQRLGPSCSSQSDLTDHIPIFIMTQAFYEFFTGIYSGINWRFTHHRDPVPHLPLMCVGLQS